MWELNHKEGWAWKNWCFHIVVLEKTLESPLDCRIKPVNPKGNQPWIFIGKTEAEVPKLGPPDQGGNSLEKSLMLGKTEGRRREGETGWDGWMTSPTPWTWVWANSGRKWRTGKPGVLQSMGLQRIRHDWATELIWTRVKRTDKKSHCTRRPNGSSHNLVQKLTLSIPMANRKKTGTRIYHNALSFLRETVYQMVWNGKHFLTLKGWEHIIFKMY